VQDFVSAFIPHAYTINERQSASKTTPNRALFRLISPGVDSFRIKGILAWESIVINRLGNKSPVLWRFGDFSGATKTTSHFLRTKLFANQVQEGAM